MSPETVSVEAQPEQPRLLPASLEDRLVNWLGRAGGASLLAVIGLVWLCLLTWTVTDPSLTFATGGHAQNGLGALGAIVSDLLLQMLGFATAIALLAPMLWALELMAADRVPGFRTKASFYPLSILLLAGALSTLPVTATWPLHHGLGGILGDLIANVGNAVFGIINPERASAATGFVLFVSGFSALGYSIGLDMKDLSALVERRAKAAEEIRQAEKLKKAAAGVGLGAVLAGLWRRRKADDTTETGGDRDGGDGAAHSGAADGQTTNEPSLPGLDRGFARGPDGYSDAERAAWWQNAQQAPPPGWNPHTDPAYAQGYPHGGQPGHPGAPMHADPDWARRDWSQAQAPNGAQHGVGPHGTYPHDQQNVGEHDRSSSAWDTPIPLPLVLRGKRDQRDQRDQHVEPPRDPAFDIHTEASSRGMAVRFAPPGGNEPARATGSGEQPRRSGGIFSGFPFRRPEPAYKRPSLNLLKRPATTKSGPEFTQTVLRGNARLLEDVLADFGVKGEVRDIKPGPVVTLYELEPARGIKSSRVIGLADDIARSMSANAVRVAVVPGRNAIGIELPNARREGVLLREILETEQFRSGEAILPLALGKGIGGEPIVADLARMPHLLVAGTTGSGKSVGINAMVLSLLFRHAPEDCRLIMIDPKMLELSVYNGIPHLLTPVVTDPIKAVAALTWAVGEMEERYKRMAKLSVRNIDVFNNRVRNAKKRGELMQRSVQTGFDKRGQAVYETEPLDLEPMPYIVIVVDEFADLMIVAGKEIEAAVQRLAQMARAAGIHLVMATQRPSVDIVTGTIKANFPTRVSFKVASKIDSRTILNDQGAEQLLGQGDMLYSTGTGQPMRVHGPFVSDEEVETIARFLREQGEPRYVDGITEPATAGVAANVDARVSGEDDLYDRAVAIVMRDRKASTSYVQRRLSIGYNRAADLVERMEREGLISPPNPTGKREILAGPGGSADEV